MTVIINPGTEPCLDANADDAWTNMRALIAECGLPDADIERDPSGDDDGGRWYFVVRHYDRECSVEMPGWPLERVRYTGDDDQNIWHFPRLYVDGDSWVWKYAVSQLRDALTGVDES